MTDPQQPQEYDTRQVRHLRQYAPEIEANALASDLELQYTVHGPRDQADVRRVDPPVPVDGWRQRIGELDAWINEGGRWLGRVRHAGGRVSFIDQSQIRPVVEHGAG